MAGEWRVVALSDIVLMGGIGGSLGKILKSDLQYSTFLQAVMLLFISHFSFAVITNMNASVNGFMTNDLYSLTWD